MFLDVTISKFNMTTCKSGVIVTGENIFAARFISKSILSIRKHTHELKVDILLKAIDTAAQQTNNTSSEHFETLGGGACTTPLCT